MGRFFFAGLFLMVFFCGGAGTALAQAQPAAESGGRPPERIIRPMIAVDTITLQAEGMRIRLWGIKPAQTSETPLDLRALDLMDRMIGNEQVNCKIMYGTIPDLFGRCTTQAGQDLGLELLANGYAVVDRRQTYNTVFASAYAGAQDMARLNAKGIWGVMDVAQKESTMPKWLQPYMGFLVPVMLVAGPLVGLSIIALVMGIWLSRMQRGQQRDIEQARSKEAALETRERQVLVSTLEGELQENKNRIEAFLVIYGDMLQSLQNKNETPKYQQVGDIVQKHPGYSKTIFDSNVNKLSLLDIKLAGQVSKLYTVIPKDQEYINLDPNVPLETAIKLVEKVMQDAENLLPPINAVLTELQAISVQK